MNYKDIIAQALRKGFQPYGGNDTQQQVMIDGLEVSPYFELTGQSEQEFGSPQQMGYSISTPLGGTRYRTDVLDMNSNFLRSHEHDAGEDKYGLRDMSKLALAALGANYLPGLFVGGEAAGVAGAGETVAGTGLLSSAPLSTTLGAPLTELTAGGLLTDVGLPAVLSEAAIPAGLTGGTAASTLAGLTPAAADTVQQIVTTGKLGSAPSLLSTVGPGAAAATLAATTLATDPANYSNEGRNPTDRANMGPDAQTVPTVDVSTGPLDGLKAWAVTNPELAKLLFSGGGALLSAAGGPSSKSPGGYVDSGYRPTISREGWNPAPQARQMAAQPTGLLMSPSKGETNSGLWRYAGLLSGQGANAMSAQEGLPSGPKSPPITRPTPTQPINVTPPAQKVGTPTGAGLTQDTGKKLYELPDHIFGLDDPYQKAAIYNLFKNNSYKDDYINAIANRTQQQDPKQWQELAALAATMPTDLIKNFAIPGKEELANLVNQWRSTQQQTGQMPSGSAATAAPSAAPRASAGYNFATQPNGIGEAKYYENIANFMRNAASEDDVRQAMQQYGIDDLDVNRAQIIHGLPGKRFGLLGG